MRSREAIEALVADKAKRGIFSVRLLAQDTLDLLAENARLRALVEDGWRQDWRCGYSVCCANLDPTTQQMDADWLVSPLKAALGGKP